VFFQAKQSSLSQVSRCDINPICVRFEKGSTHYVCNFKHVLEVRT